MRTACLLIGMFAIGLELQVGAAFAIVAFKVRWLPGAITIAAALLIAWRLVMKPPLAQRWHGPDWMAWAIAAAAGVGLLLGPFSPWSLLTWPLGFRTSAVLEAVAGVALVGLLAKLAYDTPRETPSEGTAEPPTIRLLLASWMVLLVLVVTPLMVAGTMFWDAGLASVFGDLKALLSGEGLSTGTKVFGWGSWLATGMAAWFLLTRTGIVDRIPSDRPGVGMVSWGVALWLLVMVPALVLTQVESGSRLVFMFIGFAVVSGPVAVLAQVLLVVGLFRVLSNLEPEYVEDTEGDGGEPAPEPKSSAPAPAAAAPAAPVALAPATTVAEARAQLAGRPHDTVLHQQLHKLLLADPAAGAELFAHARDYIALLVKQARGEQALGILKACLQKDPAFRPHPDQVLPLANLVMAHGDPMLALRLMHEFDRLNPGHAATAGVLYLSARVLRSQNKLVPASRILDQLLQRFPNDPLVPQARSLREALERLIAAPPANPKPA